MEPDFWLERWRLSQIEFHQHEINAHLQECWPGLAIAPNEQVFGPLRGTRVVRWLIRNRPVVPARPARGEPLFPGSGAHPPGGKGLPA
jgi:thiopurine S-methyltransferase